MHDDGDDDDACSWGGVDAFNLQQARLLLTLPKLSCLPRGDFLCEAVDWVEWLESEEGRKEAKVTLGVQEFHYSEEYHFHTVAQVRYQNVW